VTRRRNKAIDVFRYIDMQGGAVEPCWSWTGALGGRDHRPYFTVDGSRRLAYRIVYEICNGVAIEQGILVRHKCDNKICCNPHHLELGTHQENMNDMKERERHGLPHHTVRRIQTLLEKGEHTHKEIAEAFGTSRQLITEINRGTLYQHVEKEQEEPT